MPTRAQSVTGTSNSGPLLSLPQHASIRAKVFRQSVLLVSFCVLLLGGLSFFVTTQFLTDVTIHSDVSLADPRTIGFTILILTALLVVLAFFLSTLLAKQLTRSLRELANKVTSIRPDRWEFPQTLKTGDEIEVLDHVIADLTHRLQHVYLSLKEEAKESRQELRREQAVDATILHSIGTGAIVFDTQGKMTHANPAAIRLLQNEHLQVSGTSATEVLKLYRRTGEMRPEDHPVSQVLSGKATYRSHPEEHMRLMRHDQTLLPVSIVAAPLLHGDLLLGGVLLFEDMTEERQIDYLKSEFISLASHQLRTPLSSIRWYLELLGGEGKQSLNEEQKSYLAEIDGASTRMANLIEALLHVARIEGGVMVPEPKRINLSDLLTQLSKEWDALTRKKGIVLNLTIPGMPSSVTTDPILLQIVLQNLLSNALKYSPEHTSVSLSLEEGEKGWKICVKDQGVGIPAEDQVRLFEKFFRARNVRQMDTDGNGLGLYISKSIVAALGGELGFTSESDKGTTFCVSLPKVFPEKKTSTR